MSTSEEEEREGETGTVSGRIWGGEQGIREVGEGGTRSMSSKREGGRHERNNLSEREENVKVQELGRKDMGGERNREREARDFDILIHPLAIHTYFRCHSYG